METKTNLANSILCFEELSLKLSLISSKTETQQKYNFWWKR